MKEIEKLAEEAYPINHMLHNNRIQNAILDAQRKAFIAGAKSQSMSEWVSVEDRLPYRDGESSIYCLVMAKGYDIIVRPYNEYHKCWDEEDGDDHFTKDVGGLITHWQPLPPPPQTGK